MRARWVVVLTAALSVGMFSLAVTGVRVAADVLTLPLVHETCDTDATVSGLQGWCVQTRHRDQTLLTDARTELWIVPVYDGQQSSRFTVFPFPFQNGDEDCTSVFSSGSLTVTDTDGNMVVYPETSYADD